MDATARFEQERRGPLAVLASRTRTWVNSSNVPGCQLRSMTDRPVERPAQPSSVVRANGCAIVESAVFQPPAARAR